MKGICFLILALSHLNFPVVRAQGLLINEFQTSNGFTVTDNYGEYDDWIELSNISGQDINLNGYFITDDLNQKSKFMFTATGNEFLIPRGGYLVLWADDEVFQGHNHLNFNISGKEGLIALFSPSLQLIDSVNYSRQYMDLSLGRIPASPYSWKFFRLPTPGRANASPAYKGVVNPPVFSKKTGIYTSPVELSILPSHPGDSVYYTFNSTTPTPNSTLYTNKLRVENTSIINALVVKSGYISSSPASQLYLIRPAYSIPVLAILTDSLNLFGADGIYTNYNKSWEKFCQVRYLSNGLLKAESNAGIRIQGASSTYMPKKAFRLFFRSDYGNSRFNYPIFGPGNIDSFDKLVLKPGYDDDITTQTGTLLRDALSVELWKKTGGLRQLSTWVILYLNNTYWGIYNLRESIDEHYISDHTGLSDFDLIRFRNGETETIYGTPDDFNNMYYLVRTSDLTRVQEYHQLASLLNMDDFINLMAFVQCTAYYSWCWGISMFRENSATGQWRTSIWDTDRAYDNPEWNGFLEVLDNAYGDYWANIIPQRLLASPIFKQLYSNRLNHLMQTVFEPDNAIAVLDSLYQIIAPEMSGELARWKPSNYRWENNVEQVREFLRRRPDILHEQMIDFLPAPIPDSVISLEQGESEDHQQFITVYPNPFTSKTYVSYCIKRSSKIDISIYDQSGRLVRDLYCGDSAEEASTVVWDGSSQNGSVAPPGLYIIRLITADDIIHTKVMRR